MKCKLNVYKESVSDNVPNFPPSFVSRTNPKSILVNSLPFGSIYFLYLIQLQNELEFYVIGSANSIYFITPKAIKDLGSQF